MINIKEKIKINSNDFLLSVKTMLEEVTAYYRLNGDFTTKTAFDGVELTEFAGLDDYFASYPKIKEVKPNLEHLVGFRIVIPPDFDFSCKQNIKILLAIRSEICNDTKIKQNKVFDYLRFTFNQGTFFWGGEIATDINPQNTANINPKKYRINNFKEIEEKGWLQAEIQQDYIVSQMQFTAKIFNNN